MLILAQVISVPFVQLHDNLFLSQFLTSRAKNDPSTRDPLVRSTATRDSSYCSVGNELVRLCEETVLNFDGGDLRA